MLRGLQKRDGGADNLGAWCKLGRETDFTEVQVPDSHVGRTRSCLSSLSIVALEGCRTVTMDWTLGPILAPLRPFLSPLGHAP